jgi:hypothetical protein
MASSFLAISDMIADAFDLSPADTTDLVTAVPLLQVLKFDASSNGNTHKYSKKTTLPTVGFRAENAGRDLSKLLDTVITRTLKILDFSWAVDKTVADGSRKGRQWLIQRQGLSHVQAAFIAYEKQLIYGTTSPGDAAGFAGISAETPVTALAGAMVVDATGSSANATTSCWAVKIGPDDLLGVYNGDAPMMLGETITQDFVDGSSKHYPAYYTPGSTQLAVQTGSIYSLGRIVNLTTQGGKGLTDALISKLLQKFPVGFGPTHLVMNRQSRQQLQASRTATNPTGAPAPFPEEAFGVPIIVVESIVNTEAVVI